MRNATKLRILGVGLMLGCTAVKADEIMLDGKPCNSTCQVWMGVTPRAKVIQLPQSAASDQARHEERQSTRASAPASQPAAAPAQATSEHPASAMDQGEATTLMAPSDQDHGPLPEPRPEDRIAPLDPNRLVAVRGAVMVETSDELAWKRRQRAALIRETTKDASGSAAEKGR